jgi:hypothetical protein
MSLGEVVSSNYKQLFEMTVLYICEIYMFLETCHILQTAISYDPIR